MPTTTQDSLVFADEIIAGLPKRGVPGSELTIVTHVRGGQPRPYADHETVTLVTIVSYDYFGDLDLDRERNERVLFDTAKRAAGASRLDDEETHLERSRAGGAEGMSAHFETFLRSIERVGPHSVEILVITPFTD